MSVSQKVYTVSEYVCIELNSENSLHLIIFRDPVLLKDFMRYGVRGVQDVVQNLMWTITFLQACIFF